MNSINLFLVLILTAFVLCQPRRSQSSSCNCNKQSGIEFGQYEYEDYDYDFDFDYDYSYSNGDYSISEDINVNYNYEVGIPDIAAPSNFSPAGRRSCMCSNLLGGICYEIKCCQDFRAYPTLNKPKY